MAKTNRRGQSLFDVHVSSEIHRSAEVSDCGLYRWWLRRAWTFRNPDGTVWPGKGAVCFVMLNPSTADGLQDDPTIRRCIGFAQSWGYHTLIVRNLFPWRATNPKELFRAATVTGGERGDIELLTAMTADLVVAAWGAGVPFGRNIEALKIFDSFPAKPIHCLELTKHGHPRHPLYVKSDRQPRLFLGPRNGSIQGSE